MTAYAALVARGWLMVSLVSSNTYLIAHGHLLLAATGGFAISALWWVNARSSSRTDLPWAWVAYACGAALGTATGMVGAAWLT